MSARPCSLWPLERRMLPCLFLASGGCWPSSTFLGLQLQHFNLSWYHHIMLSPMLSLFLCLFSSSKEDGHIELRTHHILAGSHLHLNWRSFYYIWNKRREVKNRFQGLDLIECLKNYGWRFMTLQGGGDQNNPQEKEMQKAKLVVWGGPTNSWGKKRS